ncbi:hypothetical protein VRRI112168_10815 [Vreelandella rituensis]|uniref:Uncharacterized protein n=1 Tax=Vreelandella rituensis TaxID=2282306 RepID=A0A368TZT1_9GAMM|nr:hypothetical protein [Halomonas rituensis]RCV90305.1 hypothetical protein DU506_11865 [Halomonas rituensis]
MTAQQIDNIELHSQRAWALASMLQTYLSQGTDEPSREVMSGAVAEIWERLDAIGAELHRKPVEEVA